MEKMLVCDSSALISLADSCLLSVLKFFNKRGVEFLISPSVYEESVAHPLSMAMKAYQWSALNIRRLVDEDAITLVKGDTIEMASEIMEAANHMFFARGKPIHLVDLGEAEMIALAYSLREAHLLMDERTTRMLIESPFRLKEHLEKELRVNIMINREAYATFASFTKGMEVYRSADLVFVAYKKGYFRYRPRESLEAALYKLKYSGCSISFSEIEELLSIA